MPSGKFWTKEETEIVRQHYRTRGAAWCAAQVGRTEDAVIGKADRLRVQMRPVEKKARLAARRPKSRNRPLRALAVKLWQMRQEAMAQ